MPKTLFYVALEQGTTNVWYGRIIQLPGCVKKSSSKQKLLDSLYYEIENYYKWLTAHNEKITLNNDFEIEIREEKNFVQSLGESGGCVALFDFDRTSVDLKLLNRFFVLMNYSRADLFDLISKIDTKLLDKQLPNSKRSIIQILNHIANAEEWYISRFGEEAENYYQNKTGFDIKILDNLPILQRLSIVREASLETLREFAPKFGSSIFIREKFTEFKKEEWSAHKVLRRFIEHEKEHFWSIQSRYYNFKTI